MPKEQLSSENAQVLSDRIIALAPDMVSRIRGNNEQWELAFESFVDTLDQERKVELGTELKGAQAKHPLENYLCQVRKKIIDRESLTEVIKEIGVVRIFPPKQSNILLDKYDIFGRGIDSARAVLEIIRCAKKADPRLTRMLELALKKFHFTIQQCGNSSEGLKQAKQELKKFNNTLCSFLQKRKICSSLDAAKKSINFVRDFLWKKTWQGESFCTITSNTMKNWEKGLLLRFVKPMAIGNNLEKSLWERAYDAHRRRRHMWHWYESLCSSFGAWFESFTEDHLKELSHLSPTPMSRMTPNPANAYDSTIISVDSLGHVIQMLQGTQLAITEPQEVEKKKQRRRLTFDSHVSVVLGKKNQRLLETIERQFNRWSFLLDEKTRELDVPILHQTLIGDQVFPLIASAIPDTEKSETSLDSREFANAKLRKYFESHHIYYNPGRKLPLIIQKHNQIPPPGYYKINIKMLETNNCVNNHYRYTRVRNNDVIHSRELIKIATTRLEDFKKYLSDCRGSGELDGSLEKILTFLRSDDYSYITPYKSYSDEINRAIDAFTEGLREAKLVSPQGIFPLTACHDLALLTQAAAELKCTVHETYAGAMRRWCNNTWLFQLPYLGGLLRFGGWLVSLPLRLVQVPKGFYMFFNHNTTRRKTAHKAVNEQMVAELLGEKFGGCMSSEDRGEEIEQFKEANLRAFHDRGRILRFNEESASKRKFMRQYGKTTQEKHNFNKMSTGSPTSSDKETRPWAWLLGDWFGRLWGGAGNFSAEETRAEQNLSVEMGSLRKGVYWKRFYEKSSILPIEDYIREETKNSEEKSREEKTDMVEGRKGAVVDRIIDSHLPFFLRPMEKAPPMEDKAKLYEWKSTLG